ncbi:MAG: hypothetical protein R2860_10755 [Desulfobacterales bacterium]
MGPYRHHEGGRVVQVGCRRDSQNPADDYVRAFRKAWITTNVISAGDIVRDTYPTILKTKAGSLRAAQQVRWQRP